MSDSLIVNVVYVMLLKDAVWITALCQSPRGFRTFADYNYYPAARDARLGAHADQQN